MAHPGVRPSSGCLTILLQAASLPGVGALPRRRTALQSYIRSKRSQQRRVHTKRTAARRVTGSSIPFVRGSEDSEDLRPDKVADSEDGAKERSTITPAERKAFARLYELASADVSAVSGKAMKVASVAPSVNDVERGRTRSNSEDNMLADILSAAKKTATAEHPKGNRVSQTRTQAQQSDDTVMDGNLTFLHKEMTDTFAEISYELDMRREAEMERIESQLKAAATDAELWQVMERDVFSAIRQLNLSSSTRLFSTSGVPISKRTAIRRATSISGGDQEAVPMEQQLDTHNTTQLAVLGPNYPSYLLLAMRRLRKSFPSSTLPSAILPTIKSLGRTSYVLGASTALYNELLSHLWLSFADFQGIESTLADMEKGGIQHDAETLRILSDIIDEQQRAQEGQFGIGMQLVSLMERCTTPLERLSHWQYIIRQSLKDEALRKAQEVESDNGQEVVM